MDLATTIPIVEDFARQAGEILRVGWGTAKSIEYKGAVNLVTDYDRRTEKHILGALSDRFPYHRFNSEEEGEVGSAASPYTWMVDPLDGTTNFVHGVPIFSVSIALASNEVPILGVVYEVNRDECFYAVKGGGAYCNGQEIKVSTTSSLADSLIVSGYPARDFDQLPNYIAALNMLMPKTQGMRRLGSAATDLAYVACGRVSCFFESNINSYDVAAGALIVQEAGGQVTDFSGGDNWLFGREIIAGNGVHAEVLQVVSSAWQ